MPRGGQRQQPRRMGAAVAPDRLGQHARGAVAGRRRPAVRTCDHAVGPARSPDAAAARAGGRSRPAEQRPPGREFSGGVGRRRAHRGCRRAWCPSPGSRVPEPRRPRLRQGRAGPRVDRVRAGQARSRRGRPAARPAVDVTVGDGSRPAAALDRVPLHRARAAGVRAGPGHHRHSPRALRDRPGPLRAGIASRARGSRLVRGRARQLGGRGTWRSPDHVGTLGGQRGGHA
jgi:hypothetical protein